MNVYQDETGIEIVLSRRNLKALLAKLDGHPPASDLSIYKGTVIVSAEEDETHYRDRTPGPMHPDTEAAIA